MTEPEYSPPEQTDSDEDAAQPASRLSRRAILTIIAIAFVLGLFSSWVVNRL